MSTIRASAVSCARLHAAGWSIGDLASQTPRGPRWLVTGTNGENAIQAEGACQAEAWHRACEQAEAVRMLRRNRNASL